MKQEYKIETIGDLKALLEEMCDIITEQGKRIANLEKKGGKD